jgi:hypothetical protein
MQALVHETSDARSNYQSAKTETMNDIPYHCLTQRMHLKSSRSKGLMQYAVDMPCAGMNPDAPPSCPWLFREELLSVGHCLAFASLAVEKSTCLAVGLARLEKIVV